MRLKITLKLLLLTGIVSSVAIFHSCAHRLVEPILWTKFIHINKSSHTIKIEQFLGEYSGIHIVLKPNDSLCFEHDIVSGGFQAYDPHIYVMDSVRLIFDDKKELWYRGYRATSTQNPEPLSVFGLENYTEIDRKGTKYKAGIYEYSFTDAHYDLATDIAE